MTTSAQQTGAAGKANEHSFTITVNANAFPTNQKVMTGTQIKTLAGIPPEYELFEVRGSNSVPVGNGESVHIHEGSAFRAIPAGTFGNL